MMIEDFGFIGVDEKVIKKEKAKARDLRRTSWWKNKIAAGICHYCGKKFPAKALTMDHLIPLARGGTSSKGNIVAACKECNTKKKTLLPLEWEEYMSSLDRPER
jgi:5-methylcytosine-specific restriction protein A